MEGTGTMKPTPEVGTLMIELLCGERYEHVVTRVINSKTLEVQQGSTLQAAYGPLEIVTLRKNGRWVAKGASPSVGYFWVAR